MQARSSGPPVRAQQEDFDGLLEGRSRGIFAQAVRRRTGEQPPGMKQRHARCQLLHLRQSMRGEQHRRTLLANDFVAQESAKFGGGQRVKAARGLIEKDHRRGEGSFSRVLGREGLPWPPPTLYRSPRKGARAVWPRDCGIGSPGAANSAPGGEENVPYLQQNV